MSSKNRFLKDYKCCSIYANYNVDNVERNMEKQLKYSVETEKNRKEFDEHCCIEYNRGKMRLDIEEVQFILCWQWVSYFKHSTWSIWTVKNAKKLLCLLNNG